jgi:hypothetical protein
VQQCKRLVVVPWCQLTIPRRKLLLARTMILQGPSNCPEQDCCHSFYPLDVLLEYSYRIKCSSKLDYLMKVTEEPRTGNHYQCCTITWAPEHVAQL